MTERRSSVRLALTAAMVFGLAAACGSGASTTTSSTLRGSSSSITPAPTTTSLPVGYTAFTDVPDHFRIAVPTSWRQVDPNSAGAAKTLQDIVAANPDLKSAFGNGPSNLAASGTKFLAIDPSAKSGFAPNLNIIAKAAIGATDADVPQVLDGLKSQYQTIGGTVTSSSTVPLAGHQALEVKVQLPLHKPAGGTTTVYETQYLVAANDFVYILTFAGSSPAFTIIKSTFSVS